MSIISMIDDPWWTELEWFQPIEKSFDDIVIEIIIYLTTRQNETYGVTHKEVFDWSDDLIMIMNHDRI